MAAIPINPQLASPASTAARLIPQLNAVQSPNETLLSLHWSTELIMERLTPAIQTYSILAVALAAGTNLSTSIVTLPALLHAPPSTLVTQWKILYDEGIVPVVSLALSSSVGFATLAYRSTLAPTLTPTGAVSHAKRNLYVAAAVAAFGLAPYTRILMMSTIDELMRREKAQGQAQAKGEKEGTHALVRKWGRLNLIRGAMLLLSAGLGAWASLS